MPSVHHQAQDEIPRRGAHHLGFETWINEVDGLWSVGIKQRGMWKARKDVPHDGGGPNSLKIDFLEFSHEGGVTFPRGCTI